MAVNALLLRRAFAPLERLAQRMETVDLLRPGQRLQVVRDDEVGRVVRAFNRMLDRLESERQQSARRVLAAQEAERGRDRARPARRGRSAADRRAAAAQLDRREPRPSSAMRSTRRSEAVRRALDEVRRISSELRPEMLEHLGLVSALTELTTTFARVSGIGVERDFDPSLPKLAPEAELAVYRIAQESLTNVARHCEASRVTITLERGHDSVVLRVADDGRGFDGRCRRSTAACAACASARCSSTARSRSRNGPRAASRCGSKFPPRRSATGGSEELMPIPLVTRILIADDFAIVRSGLKKVLDAKPDLEVVAEAEDGAEAVEKALKEDVHSRSSTSRCRA